MNPIDALKPGEHYRGRMTTFRANVGQFDRLASGARRDWCYSNHAATVLEGQVIRFVEFDPYKATGTGRQFWAVARRTTVDTPGRFRLEFDDVTAISERDYMRKLGATAMQSHAAKVRREGSVCYAGG